MPAQTLQVKSLQTLSKLLDLMRSKGVTTLKLGDVVIQMEPGSFAAPPAPDKLPPELLSGAEKIAPLASNYEDPDLYPDGLVPIIEKDQP